MDLAIAELVARPDFAGARFGDHRPVLDRPARLPAAAALPVGEVLAVEQDHRVRRRLAGLVLGAARARGDDRRERPVAVVDVPAAARQHRRILVADFRPGLVLADAQRRGRDQCRHRQGEHRELSSIRRHSAPGEARGSAPRGTRSGPDGPTGRVGREWGRDPRDARPVWVGPEEGSRAGCRATARTRGSGIFQGPSLTAAAAYCQSPPDPDAGPGTRPEKPAPEILARSCPVSSGKDYISCRAMTLAARRGGRNGRVERGRTRIVETIEAEKSREIPSRAKHTPLPVVYGIEERSRRWTQPEPGGHATGHGRGGTLVTASGDSPDTWGSPPGPRPSSRGPHRSATTETPSDDRPDTGPGTNHPGIPASDRYPSLSRPRGPVGPGRISPLPRGLGPARSPGHPFPPTPLPPLAIASHARVSRVARSFVNR